MTPAMPDLVMEGYYLTSDNWSWDIAWVWFLRMEGLEGRGGMGWCKRMEKTKKRNGFEGIMGQDCHREKASFHSGI